LKDVFMKFTRKVGGEEPAPERAPRRDAALTLTELLVVIAATAVFALMLLPALARPQPTAQSVRCMNNLKQLSAAVMMYLGDNRDCFPACGSRSTYGFQLEDWIYWRLSLPQYPLRKSPIIASLGPASTNLFRCPLDQDNRQRFLDTGPPGSNPGPYMASYSMTSYPMAYGQSMGMSSIRNGAGWYPFRHYAIKNPAGKIMLAEEQASYMPGEASDSLSAIVNDGRWIPPFDALTARHYGNGIAAFADGHVLTVSPAFGLFATNSQPDL
jgi:prepilin-type processing-associated H-X9-DG protein